MLINKLYFYNRAIYEKIKELLHGTALCLSGGVESLFNVVQERNRVLPIVMYFTVLHVDIYIFYKLNTQSYMYMYVQVFVHVLTF